MHVCEKCSSEWWRTRLKPLYMSFYGSQQGCPCSSGETSQDWLGKQWTNACKVNNGTKPENRRAATQRASIKWKVLKRCKAILHSRSGVGYMYLVFPRTVSSSTRNYEMITKGKMLLLFIKFSQLISFFNPLSANSYQKLFSPNNIHTLSRDKVMRINKMITIEKIPWSFIKFSQLILKGDVWRSVWRICMWILGLKGLRIL